ncbi:bifunctional tetrahydrofolate synthase/dihydrofolate synthase [Marinobacter nitratireducens]|nr:bifunctional tetrahydrofolate synthase/dihydrofolate synthase [Marinobacter nitratireducens]
MPPPSSTSARPPAPPGANASLDKWLSYLEAIHPTEIDLGLDRVLVVLRRLFPRKPAARIITVAGTNGKGSCVAALEALLLADGRTTGAYTSPHLQDYNERVRVNGVDVDDEALVSAFERVEAARKSVSLTYFEFGTLAAFVVFADSGVDDWILEVGLGGRLDAVNVMDADFAILTSVDIDHVAFLGNDREVIGFEKAGVLRPGISAVYAEPDPPRSVLQQVQAQKVALALAGRDYTVVKPGDEGGDHPLRFGAVRLIYGDERIELPEGPLPVNSVAAAVVAVRQLQPGLPVSMIENVLRGLAVPGRLERLAEKPAIYVDVGHNPHAAEWLSGRLASLHKDGAKVRAVYAALGDKDVEGVVRAMSKVVDHWYLAGLDVPRGLTGRELLRRFSSVVDAGADVSEDVPSALSRVREDAVNQDLVIVFGSFFTVAKARASLGASRT